MIVFWDVVLCSLAIDLMMEAVSTSETLINFYQTTRRQHPKRKSPYPLLFVTAVNVAKFSQNLLAAINKV
jgi:RNase adaptor protein for sRNA GlmZ degradation